MKKEINLDKIAEFMNSEPEEEVDNKEIENTLEYIDNQLATVKKESKEISTPEDIKKQEITVDELTEQALKQFSKLDKNTDEIYDLFYGPLAIGKDRSESSKIALLDSQRLKVEMINALAGLASAKAKLEAAKTKNVTGNTGIFVNTQSGADVGISLHNLWEGTKEDED